MKIKLKEKANRREKQSMMEMTGLGEGAVAPKPVTPCYMKWRLASNRILNHSIK